MHATGSFNLFVAEQTDQLGLTPLIDLLSLFGGWPMTQTQWNESAFDWQIAAAEALRLYGNKYLLSVYTSPDLKNTSRNIIYVIHFSWLIS